MNAADGRVVRWRHRRGELALTRPMTMAILNVTPDSFSDGGAFFDVAQCVKRAGALLAAGADILDIGGESTRPGATPGTEAEELARVIPVLRAIRERCPEAVISVDTMKPAVAAAAALAGADIINDVHGLADAAMRDVVRRHALGAVIMDDGGGECAMTDDPGIGVTVAARLKCRIAAALDAGIARECLCIDPGFGFGKRHAANWRLLAELPAIVALGLPVLVGGSRKHFIAERYGASLADGNAAFAREAVSLGALILRQHSVGV